MFAPLTRLFGWTDWVYLGHWIHHYLLDWFHFSSVLNHVWHFSHTCNCLFGHEALREVFFVVALEIWRHCHVSFFCFVYPNVWQCLQCERVCFIRIPVWIILIWLTVRREWHEAKSVQQTLTGFALMHHLHFDDMQSFLMFPQVLGTNLSLLHSRQECQQNVIQQNARHLHSFLQSLCRSHVNRAALFVHTDPG